MPAIRQDEKYLKMYDLYCQGFSLSQVGKAYGISRQAVYGGFSRRGFSLRTKTVLPYLMFNGDKYTLANHGYYRKTDGDRELMHRDVWKHFQGYIPENCDVHHKNRDRSDNRIQNLELMNHSEHASKYSVGSNQYVKRRGED